MHRGYIKIWRKTLDSGLLQLPNALAVFVYMLMEATHRPIRYGTVELDRGQLVTGRHKLSSVLQMSEQSVRTALEHLIKFDFITSKSTNKYTVYTIVNYSKYQDIDTIPNQQATNEQPTSSQQATTIQEHKHINTKEETKPTSAKSAISIKKFIENCDSAGERRIPEDDPVFEFAESAGISLDMVKVCWNHFVDVHTQNGKRQKDWRATFRNCVKGNWYKLWFVEADGTVKETSQYRALKKGQPNV